MKKTSKIFSLLLALIMVFAVAAPAFAAEEVTTTDSVTIHKMLLPNTFDNKAFPGTKGLDNKEYTGNQITDLTGFFGEGATPIDGVYFVAKYASGANIGKYVTIKEVAGQDPVYGAVASLDAELEEGYKLLAGKTENGSLTLTTKGLAGDFELDEIHEKSSYVSKDGKTLTGMKAVPVTITLPLVNEDGIVKEAHVYPKNTEDKPQIDKNFKQGHGQGVVTDPQNNNNDGAKYENYKKEKAVVSARLGKPVPFDVTTEIPKDAKYKKLVWDDQMQKGLTYDKNLEIKLNGNALEKGTDYRLVETDRGFRAVMLEAGLTKVEEAAKTAKATITLNYSAHLNNTAVVDKPEKNSITLDYSNLQGSENESPEVKPSNGEISVEKSWSEDKTITEADRHVKALFTLQEKQDDGSWKDVETYESNYNENFTHTFKNLDDNKVYRVVESVSGYEPKYVSEQDGKVVIVNEINENNPNPLHPTEPGVQYGGRKFVKTNNEDKDSKDLQRLLGAEFYLMKGDKYLKAASKDQAKVDAAKEALDNAVKAYNALDADKQTAEEKKKVDDAQAAYNKAFFENATNDEETTEMSEAIVLVSDSEGRISIAGLDYAKDYHLKEKTPPKGYAKLNKLVDFEVYEGSYASTDEELQYNKDNAEAGYGIQIKNKLVSIPETGGIGSVIFVVAGIALMGLAAVKMRSNKQEAR